MTTKDVQLSLFNTLPTCHFKGCAEPVVGSSTAQPQGHVCKKHNELEWANALSKGKDGYWNAFGKRWLKQIEEGTS